MRAIDADALINELNNSHYPGAPYIDAGISIAIGKVCDAPTIAPEREKGEWERKSFYDNTPICSKCYCEGNWEWDYCPNCGADMRGEE